MLNIERSIPPSISFPEKAKIYVIPLSEASYFRSDGHFPTGFSMNTYDL